MILFINSLMRLERYLLEKVKDIRWFESLPDYDPPSKIKEVQRKHGLKTRWKDAGKSFKFSRYVEFADIIAVPGTADEKTMLHELGHAAYFRYNSDWIKSLTRHIKEQYKSKVPGWSYKTFKFDDDNEYAYSHSGGTNEDKEIWAILFALYHTGYKFPDEKIKQAMEIIFKG